MKNKAENNLITKTVRIPKHLINELNKTGEKNYRSFNGELIVAIETYLADWKNKH